MARCVKPVQRLSGAIMLRVPTAACSICLRCLVLITTLRSRMVPPSIYATCACLNCVRSHCRYCTLSCSTRTSLTLSMQCGVSCTCALSSCARRARTSSSPMVSVAVPALRSHPPVCLPSFQLAMCMTPSHYASGSNARRAPSQLATHTPWAPSP